MSRLTVRGGVAFASKVVFFLQFGIIAFWEAPLIAQTKTGYRPAEEPGIYGVRIHPGALAPNRRKWYLPQNLYYEYNWRGWEYSNYAREHYQRYVNIELEGTRHYDPFGNYIARGWEIYGWTETSPQRLGSGIFKSPFYSGWFSSIVISSAQKGQFHMALTVSDALRTTLTPLTFSKPGFNGLQWDFLTDKYAITFLRSRLNSPAIASRSQAFSPTRVENITRLLGFRGLAQLGDFSKLGATWVNASHANSELDFGENSLKGVLTGPQNTGNVETVVIRISDDSPESPESGAVLFFDQVIIDGEIHPEITPLVKGGVRRVGILEANGSDAIELVYDLRNNFRPTEKVPTFRDAKKLEFELIVANDFRIEGTSNLQTNRFGDQVFLPVAQARDNITDGSNQQLVRYEYGLPTGNEVIGLDLEVLTRAGFELRAEYVVNRQFRRFPNQNFRILPAAQERATAFYITSAYVHHPWFAYGETFSMDPDYSTTAFIGDARGEIDYDFPTQHNFEFIDDNDDQDRFPDWSRRGQGGQTITAEVGVAGEDLEVFPGLDENNDLVSDFNQNRNEKPDYTEPFLRYVVDPPEFLFGMDMNNNTLIDRFEDDREPDYPYERDHRGYNLYGGLEVSERIQLTIGHLSEDLISSARKSRSTYGLLTARWNYPGLNISLFEHIKFVEDDIPENRLLWVDPDGLQDFTDPLDNRDTFVNSTYLEGRYFRIDDLNISGKLKYEKFIQRGEQADLKRNRSFIGLINKADYAIRAGENLIFWPKWKSVFRREVPSVPGGSKAREITQNLFFIGKYSILPTTWAEFGIEFSAFENLRKRPAQPPPGFVDDFRSMVYSLLFSNTSAYLGYELTLNAGFQLERRTFEEETRTEFTDFIRLFASTGGL